MIIPFNKPKTVAAVCSFCKKPKEQVKSLVASEDGRYRICDKCIDKCKTLLSENN